jgi:hypothetical protein
VVVAFPVVLREYRPITKPAVTLPVPAAVANECRFRTSWYERLNGRMNGWAYTVAVVADWNVEIVWAPVVSVLAVPHVPP